MRRRKSPAAALAACLALSAAHGGWVPVCAQEAGRPLQEKAPKGPYRLQPGDEIAVAVTPQKGFDTGGVILPDGALYLKNIGKIEAAGLTIEALTERIRKVLDQELVEPNVTVSLVRMAPPPAPRPMVKPGKVTVVGGVARTGPIDLEEGLRVRKALDLAGGTVKEADLTRVVILHRDLTQTIVDLSTLERVSDPAHNRLLQDGDSIEVRLLPAASMRLVRIAGQVANPNQYELKPGMTLEDLILAAGKLTTLADLERIELRRANGKRETIHLPDRLKQGLNGKVLLDAGDEVFIPELGDRVILLGVVPRPGPTGLKPGIRVRDFFLAGSPEVSMALNPAVVDLDDVELLRPGQPSRKLDLKAVLKRADHKDNLALQSGDVLFLPPREFRNRRSVLDYAAQLGPLSFLFGLF